MSLKTLESSTKLNSFHNLDIIYHIAYIPPLAGFASGVPTSMPVGVPPPGRGSGQNALTKNLNYD